MNAIETKKPSKVLKLPTKTTINLAQRESRRKDVLTLTIGGALILVLAGSVAKFGVIDQLDRLSQAESSYNQVHSQYLSTLQAVEDYPEVEERYRTYSRSWMNAGDQNGLVRVDRQLVLDLIERRMMPRGQVDSLSLRDSILVVSMSGMNLRQISDMVERIRQEPIVESAALNLASTERDSKEALLDFTLTIALQPKEEAAE